MTWHFTTYSPLSMVTYSKYSQTTDKKYAIMLSVDDLVTGNTNLPDWGQTQESQVSKS